MQLTVKSNVMAWSQRTTPTEQFFHPNAKALAKDVFIDLSIFCRVISAQHSTFRLWSGACTTLRHQMCGQSRGNRKRATLRAKLYGTSQQHGKLKFLRTLVVRRTRRKSSA